VIKHLHSVTRLHHSSIVAAFLLGCPFTAQAAECPHPGVYGDSELAMTFASTVDTAFRIYFAETYSIHLDDFVNSFTSDPYASAEYLKLMYSHWLVWHGIDWAGSLNESEPFVDPNDGQLKVITYNRAWHSPALDYGAETMTAGKLKGGHRFHDGYRLHQHVGSDPPGKTTYATCSSISECGLFGCSIEHRRVTFYCPAFNGLDDYEGDAAGRAATLVHEFWHAHNAYQWSYWHHEKCFQETEPPDDYEDISNCDQYNPVSKGAFAPGNWYKSRPARFLDPGYFPMGSYQAELHFACDLADFPKPWIPQVVVEDADWTAYNIMVTNFVDSTLAENTIPFSCGPATPYGGAPGETRWEDAQGACGSGIVSCKTSEECPRAKDTCLEGCCFEVPG